MPERILVLSASVGAGHLRAAQAVELAARQLLSDATVKNVDVLSMTNTAFRRVYGKAYIDLVNKAPHVLGYFYDRLGSLSRSSTWASSSSSLEASPGTWSSTPTSCPRKSSLRYGRMNGSRCPR